MMKITKSNPISKRDGVKNELCIYVAEIQLITDIVLTAMRLHRGLFIFSHLVA